MAFFRCFILTALMCVFVAGNIVMADPVGKTNKAVQEIADPVLDGILQAFKTGDYDLYSKDFDDTLKDAISEEKFKQVREQINGSMGTCESRKYLGFLTRGRMTEILWKGRFTKTPDDVLIKLIMSKRGDKYLVASLWFQ